MFNTSLIKQYIKKLKFHVNSLLLPLLDLFYLQSFLYKNHTLGVMNFLILDSIPIPDSSDSTHDSGTQYF